MSTVPDFVDGETARLASEPPIPDVAREVAAHLADDSSGHDMHHAWRVFDLAMRIADDHHADVDREALGVAALAHDVHRVLDGGAAPEASLPVVRDNLDAIGAVGIARDFAFTGSIGNPIWDPDGGGPSGKRHIHDKLLRLREEMNTGAGRAIAENRHDFLERFADRFEREWHGDL